MTDVAEASGVFTSTLSKIVAPECMIKDSYFRAVTMMLFPIYMMILIWIWWKILLRRNEAKFKEHFSISVFVVLFLLLPSASRAAMRMLFCRNVGKSMYTAINLDEKCLGPMHILWIISLAIPGLLYAIILPFLGWRTIRTVRERSYAQGHIYSFFMCGFKDKMYF